MNLLIILLVSVITNYTLLTYVFEINKSEYRNVLKYWDTYKWKIKYFRCPKFWAHYSLIVMCLNIGSLNNQHILCGTNEQVVVLGVPKLRYFIHYRDDIKPDIFG